jgi:hypothetical protein
MDLKLDQIFSFQLQYERTPALFFSDFPGSLHQCEYNFLWEQRILRMKMMRTNDSAEENDRNVWSKSNKATRPPKLPMVSTKRGF